MKIQGMKKRLSVHWQSEATWIITELFQDYNHDIAIE